MIIIIGSDHAGFKLKEVLKTYLKNLEFVVVDKGTNSEESVNYPDYAHSVAEAVSKNAEALGILICGSANGVCMTANKHKEIRAALAWQPEVAALARQHNNANILCLPARFIDDNMAKTILAAYLDATFEEGRHQQRVDLI
jgi:ribose 5-phosphate isomerase B